jgi:type VI secretion system protein VasI
LVPIQEKLSIRTDLPAPSSSLKSAAAGTSQAGKWQVSEAKSKFDDSRTVVLRLAAENGIKGWLANSIPQLIVRCQERKTEVYVVTGMPASVEYGEFQRHTVRLRYDDDAAITITSSESTDNKALFIPDAMSSIRRMWTGHALVVGLTPFNANPVTIEFDISGLSSAIQPLREACGW